MFKRILHYYGDTVRRLFVLASLIMVVTLPFFSRDIALPLIVPIVAILLIGVAAGLTSPRHSWSAAVNVSLSVGGVLIFEWYAVDWYSRYGVADNFFWTNQLLAVIFLLALYFGLKTIRWTGASEADRGIGWREASFWDKSSNGDGGNG